MWENFHSYNNLNQNTVDLDSTFLFINMYFLGHSQTDSNLTNHNQTTGLGQAFSKQDI